MESRERGGPMDFRLEEKEDFQKLTLTIEIQSKRELAEMWHRFNIDEDRFEDGEFVDIQRQSATSFDIFNTLNTKMSELGLINE